MAETVELTGISFKIDSSVKEAISQLDALATTADSFASIAEGVGARVTNAFSSMSKAIAQSLGESSKTISSFASESASSLDSVNSNLEKTGTTADASVNAIISAINRLKKSLGDIGISMGVVGASAQAVSDSIVKSFDNASSSTDNFISRIKDIHAEMDDIPLEPLKTVKNELMVIDQPPGGGGDGISGVQNELMVIDKMLPAVTNHAVALGKALNLPAVKFDIPIPSRGDQSIFVNLIKLFEDLKNLSVFLANNLGKVGEAFLGLVHKVQMLALRLGKLALNKVTKDLGKLKNALANAGKKALDLSKNLARLGLTAMTQKVVDAKKKLEQLFRAFVRIATYRAIRSMIRGFAESLQAGIQNMYTWATIVNNKFKPAMDSIKSSAVYAKNSLAAMISPILEALAPALEILTDKIVSVMNAFNRLFSMLTGKSTWTKATRQTQKWADVTKSSAKEAKKAFEPFLLSIDELNKLPSKEKAESTIKSPTGDMVNADSFKTEKLNLDDNISKAIKAGNWKKVGEELAKKLNTLTDELDNWINGTFAPKAKKFAEDMADFLNGFIAKYNWAKLGKTFADGLNAIVKAGQAFIERFNWAKFGDAIGTGVDSFIKNVDWNTLGKTFGEYVKGIFTTADHAIMVWRKNAKTYGEKIANGLNEAIDAIDWPLIGKTFGDGINTVLDFANTVLKNFSFWNFGVDLGKMFDKFIQTTDFSLATKTFANAINGVVDTFGGVVSIWAQNANAYGEKLGSAINAFFKTVRWGNLALTLSGLVNSMLQTGFSFFNSIDWKGNAEKLFGSIDTFLKTVDWTALANTFGTLLNGLFDTISVATKTWVSNAGTYGKNIGNAINTFINKVNWNELGQSFVDGFNGIVKFLNGMITTLDWNNTRKKIVDSINTAIRGIDAKGFGEAVNTLLSNILDMIAGIDWYTFGYKIGQFLGSIDWLKALNTVGRAVFEGLKGAFAGYFDSAGVSALWQIPAMLLTLFGPKIFSTIGFGGIVKTVFEGLKLAFNVGGDISKVLGLGELASKVGAKLLSLFAGEGGFINFPLIAETVSGGLSSAFGALTGVLGTVGSAFGSLISAIAPFAPEIAIAVASIVAIIAIIKNWNKIVGVMKDIWNTLKGTAEHVWNAITSTVGNAVKGASQKVSETWGSIKGFLGDTWHNIQGTASNVWNGITGNLSGIWNNISGNATNVFNGIKGFLGNTWRDVSSTGNSTWNTLKGSLSGTWNTMKSNASTTFTNLKGDIGNIWNNVSTEANNKWNTIGTSLKGTWETAKANADTLFSGIHDKISETWSTVSSKTSDKWSAIQGTLGSAWKTMKENAGETFTKISESISSSNKKSHADVNENWNPAGKIFSVFSAGTKTIKELMSKYGDDMKDSNNSTMKDMKSTSSSKMKDIEDVFKDKGSTIKEGMSDKFSDIFHTVKTNMKKAKSSFKSSFDHMEDTSKGEGIESNVDDLSSTIESDLDLSGDTLSWGEDLTRSFAQGISNLQSDVEGAVTTLADIVSGMLHHSTPDYGPMKGDDKWMPDMMENMVNGIKDNTPALVASAKNVATQVKANMQGTLEGINSDANISSQISSNINVDTGSTQAQLNIAIRGAIEDAFMKMKDNQRIVVNVDGREIFNAVVKQNDNSIMRTGVSPLNR